ncbi:MAG TPA: hypothetical protein DEQ26_13215 [Flavobacteriaceae bacterium]|nr:hypothetical protein [Flavobacteriaceae bacterium]
MKKYIFILIPTLFILYGCNSDDDINNVNNTEWDLDEASGIFLEYNNTFGYLSQGGADFKYTYENGKVIKKNGGVMFYNFDTNSSLIFSEQLYDLVTYENNRIKVETKLVDVDESILSKIEYVLENNKIVQQTYSSNTLDTVKYYYTRDLPKKLIYVNGRAGIRKQSDFYYNSNQNLDSIVSRTAYFNSSTEKFEPININSRERVVEVFDQYDSYTNPTRKLGIFPELYKRSLSKNNFGRYQEIVYTSTNKFVNQSVEFPMIYKEGKILLKF